MPNALLTGVGRPSRNTERHRQPHPVLLSKQGEWINGQLLYSNGGYPKGRLPV